MEIKSVFDSSIETLDVLGIAIGRPRDNTTQQQIGILFRNSEDNVKLLHLAFHYVFKEDDFSPEYLWLDVQLDPFNKIHFATICELIFRSNAAGIPYGVGVGDTSFSNQGEFISKNKYAGLTCATFVMQVFHDQGHIIIDLENWPQRKSDKEWQAQILQDVQDYIKEKDLWDEPAIAYMAYQKNLARSGCARYKPEEVAVAATMESPPHSQSDVRNPSLQIINKIASHNLELAKNKC